MPRFLPLAAALLTLGLVLVPSSIAANEGPAFIAIGDSAAFGVGASDPAGGGYVSLAYDSLRKSDRYRDRGLELVNLSAPSATSSDILLPGGQIERAVAEISARLDDESTADDLAEIITVGIGGNELPAFTSPGSPCLDDPASGECESLLQDTLREMEENLGDALSRLRQEAPRANIVVLDVYSPLSGRGDTADTVNELSIRELNVAIQEVAAREELSARFVSVHELFRGHPELIAEDGVHPNDEGHAVIAEAVVSAIEGREPVFPEGVGTVVALEEVTAPAGAEGQGGLLPVQAGDKDEDQSLWLVVGVPMAVLGLIAFAGGYLAARRR